MKVIQNTTMNPQDIVRGDASVSIEGPVTYTFWCEPNGGECVGVHRRQDGMVQIASTLTPQGGVQLFLPEEWDALLENIRADASYVNVLNATANMFTQPELDAFAAGVRAKAFAAV